MTLHLLKLCVGVDSVDRLVCLQAERRERQLADGREPHNVHVTRNMPRRAAEVVAGGSLYWVIRRQIAVRQRILRIDRLARDDGPRCGLVLAPDLIRVEPRACRPFQGWRYLEADAAPADCDQDGVPVEEMPEAMRLELLRLGLL